jgi:hypothetical protein
LAAQESNGCELPDSNSVRALFAARYFLSAPTLWDGFEQILTNLTNKIFSVLFAGEVAQTFRSHSEETSAKAKRGGCETTSI